MKYFPFTYLFHIIFFLCYFNINLVLSQMGDDDEENKYNLGPGTASTTEMEEEWRMDTIPYGVLLDSVNRELSWYGIYQNQPLDYGSKLKAVSMLVWEHTLGRPYAILDNSPQSAPPLLKVSRQILAEEGMKWSRDQKIGQDVLLETIKTGGNGFTLRQVIGAGKRTVYIIQNGIYYRCPRGTDPDVEAYKNQANPVPERKCTFKQIPHIVQYDPCIEGETAALEYSFNDGWMFCFGSGERENTYFNNGTLDCGNKTKMILKDFLTMCAIDYNIIITYDYFGDEPRKDMPPNTTICETWNPCRLSYLYRLEPPAHLTPAFSTTTEDPCETTICADCVEPLKANVAPIQDDDASEAKQDG